jgi:glycosyltransferase involved in cell wall biosynthesis
MGEVGDSVVPPYNCTIMSKHIVIDARIRRASTGRYIDRVVEHLQQLDHENTYTVLVQPDDPWQPSAPNFKREDCKYAQFSFNPLEQIGFTRQLRKLKPDLVHFSMTQQPIPYFGKIVTTTMDLTMLRFTRPGKAPLPVFWVKMAGYRFLFWLGHRKSQRIITITNYVKEDLIKLQPFTKNKIRTTYLASEPPMEAPGQQPERVQEPFILYVGTAFPHKNLEKLVEAFELLHATNPDLRLVLAGKKEFYYEQLEKKSSPSPAFSNIIFTGFVKDEELKWLYETAEAYVFPSLSEGFGLPGLEAMTYNCPVISSNATCLPEVYDDAALYFDPNNATEMAEKIQYVLDNPYVADELRIAGQKQLKKYSWQKCAQETLEVYNEVLS